MKNFFAVFGVCLFLAALAGCSSVDGNTGNMPMYGIADEEALWIRNGEPLLYEDEPWFPQDRVDVLMDSEVSLLGVYRDVQFFSTKTDVRPYNRLYTKFGKNQFRIFKKKNDSHHSAR